MADYIVSSLGVSIKTTHLVRATLSNDSEIIKYLVEKGNLEEFDDGKKKKKTKKKQKKK